MICETKIFEYKLDRYKIRYVNMSEDVKKFVEETGVRNGTVTVQSTHSTCAVFMEEYVHDEDPKGDDYLQIDLNKGLRAWFPEEDEYDDFYKYPGPYHLDPNRPKTEKQAAGAKAFSSDKVINLNGPAHLKSTILGASETFVIEDGVIQTGPNGTIWFVDLDQKRPRQRKVAVCVKGEK